MANLDIESYYPTPFANSPLLPLLLISLASQRHTPITKREFKEEYDFIIVGAGAAGSVLASRLSEINCVSVVILEAGDDPPLLTEVPATARSFTATDVDWQFMTEPQENTAAGHVNRQSLFPAGKMVGGSSVLTGRLSNRGNRKNYDDWAKSGADGWSYKDVFPYFIKMENNVDPEFIENGYHGTKGPITTSKARYDSVLSKALKDATTNLGYYVTDSDGPLQTGFAIQQASVRDGQSCSTAKGYLVPSENRTNLDIIKNAMVTKVIIENKQAVGVQFDDINGRNYSIKARKEVILSAGAINTPKLLMLSGIGPLQEMIKHKIPLIADLPVGQNFHDHVSALLLYDISTIMEEPFEEEITKKENIRSYIRKRTGPLTLPEGALTSAFLNKKNSPLDLPDFAVYTVFPSEVILREHALWNPQLVEQLIGPYREEASISCVVQVINPKSRGSVRLKSTHPYTAPIVDPNYFESFEDVETVVSGLKTCRTLFESDPVKNLGVKPFQTTYRGCENFTGDEDLYYRCIARTAILPFYHSVGTAKMGDPLDPTTVVDPQLRVKSIEGLRVVDASVMPEIPWGNPLVTVTMIAEKAADIIKKTIECSTFSSFSILESENLFQGA